MTVAGATRPGASLDGGQDLLVGFAGQDHHLGFDSLRFQGLSMGASRAL